MVPPYNEMGAAVVLPCDGVEDRLARHCVSHRRWKDAQEGPVLRVGVLQENLITAHPDLSRDVIAFRLADQGMQVPP